MILLDRWINFNNREIKQIESDTILVDYNPNNISRFFIFANREISIYGNDLDKFLYNHPDYRKNSVVILFNNAVPLEFSSVANFTRKWIFFRCLSEGQSKNIFFRDVNLLQKHTFEKFFVLPDILLKEKNEKVFVKVFLENLYKNNIDISLLSHTNTWKNNEHSMLLDRINYGIKHYHRKKDLSSGLWTYIYLKEKYQNAKFTLIGFNCDINPETHSPEMEKKYIMQEQFFNNELELFKCF